MQTDRGRSFAGIETPRGELIGIPFELPPTATDSPVREAPASTRPPLTTWPFLGLAVLCIAGYVNSLRNGFMLDDYVVLFGASGLENKSLGELFLVPQHFFYRPVGHLLLFASHRLFGDSVIGYHLVNLGIFTLIVWAAYLIAREVSKSGRVAFMTAALYAVHPLQAFLVNYVTASIIGSFVLAMEASFLALTWFLRSGRTRHLFLSLALQAAALLSHEMAVVLPVAVVCLLYFVRRTPVPELLRLVTPYVLVTAVFLVFRSLTFPLTHTARGAMALLPHFGVYISSLGDLLGWYFTKLVWPRNVLFLWSGKAETWNAVVSAVTIAAAVAGALNLLVRRRQRDVHAFSLALFAAGFLPIGVAGFTYFPQSSPIIEPHWFYFPSLGFFLLVALGLDRLWQWRGWGIGGACAALLVATWMALLWQTNRHWRDEETYSRYWISLNDRDWTPFHGLGRAHLRRGDAQAAVRALEQALARIRAAPPTMILADLGLAHFRAGQEKLALQWLALALRQDPGYAPAYDYLGQIATKQGADALAVDAFGDALRLFPGSAAYRHSLEDARERLEHHRTP